MFQNETFFVHAARLFPRVVQSRAFCCAEFAVSGAAVHVDGIFTFTVTFRLVVQQPIVARFDTGGRQPAVALRRVDRKLPAATLFDRFEKKHRQ